MSRRPTAARLCLLLLLAAAPARALEFTASVDRTEATPADPIRLTLTLSAAGAMGHVPSPELDLTEFTVFGPSVGTRVEMINGRTTFARDLTYTLYGRTPGRYRIGPAVIELPDTTVATQPVEVQIVRRRSGRQGAGGGDGPPAVFVRAVADRDTAWVGQQVVVRFDLCYRVVPRDVGFAEIPDFTGFWQKELFVAQRLSPQREVIDGVAYNVAPLRRVGLFPTSAGTQRVDALAVTCSIPQANRRSSLSLFDEVLGAGGRSVVVRSEPLPIHVKPLPTTGRPPGFSGAVGRFDISAEASPLQVPVGDPVTLRVVIEGDGNVQAIRQPQIEPPGFEVYEPTVELEERQTPAGGYGARKSFEYILIPEQGGRQRIAAVPVVTFDPEAGQYRTSLIGPFDVAVEAGVAAGGMAPAFDLTRSEIEQLGRDIRHIKPDAEDLGAPTPLYRNGLYWVLHGVLPLAYVGLLAWQRHRRRLEGDEAYARRRRAGADAKRRLAEARSRVDEGEGFHGALHEALVGFIADRTNEPSPSLSRERCADLLRQRGVPGDLAATVDRLLERCEFARFAPGGSDAVQRQALLDEAGTAIEALREALT